MAKKEKHTHRLHRHIYKNGEQIYFCILNCKFRCNVKLALGKIVLCNVCGNPFEMNSRSIRMARPNCDSCSSKSEKAIRARAQRELEVGPKVTTDDLNLDLSEIAGIEAPKIVDPLVDLRSRMNALREVKKPLVDAKEEDSDLIDKEGEIL